MESAARSGRAAVEHLERAHLAGSRGTLHLPTGTSPVTAEINV
jgi:hypothetical protein